MATTTFESLNPSTGEVIETFPRSTADDVDRAVATARAAWEDWRLVPAPERGNILFRFAQLLEQRKPELSDLMTREMGKVKAEAGGDVQEAIDMSYYMGGEGRRLFGQTTPSELRDKFMMSVRMPVGVVHHDDPVLAAELQVDVLELVRRVLRHEHAGLARAGERDHGHVGMANERVARLFPEPVHDLHHPLGHAGLVQ